MNKTVISIRSAAALLLLLGLVTASAVAQPTKDELQKDIEDLTAIDPDIEKYLPRWKILEADLKIKLAQVFKLQNIRVSEADSMIVVATFATETKPQELLTIRVGDNPDAVISGTQKIRGTIGDLLYQEILARDYAHRAIEPAKPITSSDPVRIPNVLQPTNAKQFIAISAFRQIVQLGTTGARLEHMLGNDEIGYHFWSSGQGKAMLHYPIIPLDNPELRANGVPDILTMTLGIGYRLKAGQEGDNLLDGVIPARKLNGSIGAKALARIEYRLPQVNDLGVTLYAELPFSKLASGSQAVEGNDEVVWTPTLVPSNRGRLDTVRGAYFLRTVAQGNIFWENWLNDYEHFFRISLGMSYQEYLLGALRLDSARLSVEPPGQLANNVENIGLIHPTEFEDWLYAKVEYLNQSGFPFGLSAQVSNRNLLLHGFIPLIPNWLFIEAKYSTPLLREEAAPWEHESFFMLSPILRFQID